MEGFPFTLILAVAAASATIFVGFLPTKAIRASFFGRESFTASVSWIFVTMAAPASVMQYPLFIALFCFGSWWFFRADKILRAKMWLSLASGIGISVGIMLLLYTSPRAFPIAVLTQPRQTSLLASIYLGGATIGLAYTIYRLLHEQTKYQGVSDALIRRHAGLLFFLTLVRLPVFAVQVLVPDFFPPETFSEKAPADQIDALIYWRGHSAETIIAGIGIVLVLPLLAGVIWRTREKRRMGYAVLLFGTIAAGIEILARILVL